MSFSQLTGKLLESQIQAKTIEPDMRKLNLETYLYEEFIYRSFGAALPKLYQTVGTIGSGNVNTGNGGIAVWTTSGGVIATKSKFTFGLPQIGTTFPLLPAIIEIRVGAAAGGSGDGYLGMFDVIPGVGPSVDPPNGIFLRFGGAGSGFVCRKAGVETLLGGISGWPSSTGSGERTARFLLQDIGGVLFVTLLGPPEPNSLGFLSVGNSLSIATNVPDRVPMFVGAVNNGFMTLDTMIVSGPRKLV